MLLEAHNLSKSYQENQEPILRDLSLEIESGQFIAIMGPSGCGKSTLLNLLSTIDKPDQGQILYEGQDLLAMKDTDLDRLRREAFGFVFQQATFLDIAHRSIHQVSGGQLQRAGICRALMNQPRIIFADEPTGALNSQAGRQAMELIQHFHQQGASILLVTHDASVATYADKVLLILDGKIKKEILFDPATNQDDRRQLLLAELNQIGI